MLFRTAVYSTCGGSILNNICCLWKKKVTFCSNIKYKVIYTFESLNNSCDYIHKCLLQVWSQWLRPAKASKNLAWCGFITSRWFYIHAIDPHRDYCNICWYFVSSCEKWSFKEKSDLSMPMFSEQFSYH